jgi:hypothetical protein
MDRMTGKNKLKSKEFGRTYFPKYTSKTRKAIQDYKKSQ